MRASTPWGPAQSETVVSPEAIFYSTAGHGGYFVTGATADKIRARFPQFTPFAHRSPSLGVGAYAGLWLEEDCDWAALALVAPELFPPIAQTHAEELRSYLEGRK